MSSYIRACAQVSSVFSSSGAAGNLHWCHTCRSAECHVRGDGTVRAAHARASSVLRRVRLTSSSESIVALSTSPATASRGG